jgi:hypothetical protein
MYRIKNNDEITHIFNDSKKKNLLSGGANGRAIRQHRYNVDGCVRGWRIGECKYGDLSLFYGVYQKNVYLIRGQ